MRRLLSALVAFLALGCYVAAPLAGPQPANGTRVAITLTESGTTAMASQLGPARVRLVGDVAAATDSSLVLALRTVTNWRGIEETWMGEQVTVPRSAIESIGERHVSVGRSVGLTLAIVVAAVLVGKAIGSGGSGSTLPPPGGGVQ
jgi:hypothetical protein